MIRTTKFSPKQHASSGFTVLELMIATSVFAVVLLVAAAGILSFTKSYYKGVASTSTQTTARTIINDISQGLQLSGSINDSQDEGYVCFNDSTQYQFQLGVQVNAASRTHALVRDTGTDCSGPIDISTTATLTATQEEMLGEHMRLAAFNFGQVTGAGDATYQLHVRVVYGDDDLLTSDSGDLTGTEAPVWWATYGSSVRCKNNAGSQFCAVSDIRTTVQARL